MKEKLLEELSEAQDCVKEYDKFLHLFSEDNGVETLARLNRSLGHVLLLLRANDIRDMAHPKEEALRKPLFGKQGSLVSVRPVAEEYGGKTYLGFLIGDVALGSSITITDDKIQCNWAQYNPAIFVPELGKIIYGCASWWGEIKSEDDFKKIADSDIDNVWYVKMWKALNSKNAEVAVTEP